jgi:hypothetical protein
MSSATKVAPKIEKANPNIWWLAFFQFNIPNIFPPTFDSLKVSEIEWADPFQTYLTVMELKLFCPILNTT